MPARTLRRQVLLSTTMIVGALTGYGRGAYGQGCTGGPTVFTCSGTETTTQTINSDNATVTTVAGFNVNTATGNAISITGNGALSYTDANASLLTADAIALFINATGDDGGTPGSITIDTDGALTGGNTGIQAANLGSGATTVTVNGNVTANTFDAIYAINGSYVTPAGTDLTVTTAADTTVMGAVRGILALNNGSGATSVTANGNVYGAASEGIFARNNSGTDLTVTTGAGTTITSGTTGIEADNDGTGYLSVTANGNVYGTTLRGIRANNSNAGTNLTVTTGSGTMVMGNFTGIVAYNYGSGSTSITANGDVTATTFDAIYARNGTNVTPAGTDLTVTTAVGTTLMGGARGIDAQNNGSGATIVTANGNVYGTNNQGIFASTSGTYLSVTTYGAVIGGGNGIQTVNAGSGAVDITANGNVTGNTGAGIFASHGSGGAVTIAVGAASTVTSNGVGANAFAIQTANGPADVTVAGALNGGGSGAIQFDQVAALDDRLTLITGATVNGDVLGGPGTDSLILQGGGNGAFNVSQLVDFETGEVDSGAWNLSGATSAAFTVNGGTLMGNGTFGALTGNGGIIAPGNSIGTMTVNGVFTLNSGAVYEVEINDKGQSDKVIVNGTVNLTGATLRVLAANGTYKPKTEYVIIENDGSDPVNGTFGKVTDNLTFVTPTVIYNGGTGNDVVLFLESDIGPGPGQRSFCSVAKTRNQCNVAHALDRFPTDNPLFLAVLFQTAAGARQAFDALSGEIHATVAGTLADDSRYVREAVLGRLMQANHTGGAGGNPQLAALAASGPQLASVDANAMALGYGYDGKSLVAPEPTPLAFWTRAYGAWGDFNGDGNAASANRDLGGFVSGMDAEIGYGWRAGLATGASFANVSVDDRYSSADVESYTLGGYTGGMAGAFAIRGGGMWAWNDIDSSRAVIFPGFFERQKASYDADTGQIFGEVAYPTQIAGMAVEPFAGLAYVSIDTDSFRERGGRLASLRGVDVDQDVGYSTLGVRAATTMQFGGMQIVPHLSAAWQHAFDDVTPGANLAFASTGIGFGIEGVPLAEDSALIDAGLDLALGENTTAGVSYTGQFGDGVSDNGVKGRLTLLF